MSVPRFGFEMIDSLPRAFAFLGWCRGVLGDGFHPDTRFADYTEGNVIGRSCNSVFANDKEAKRLDRLMAETFDVLGNEEIDIYAVSLALAGCWGRPEE